MLSIVGMVRALPLSKGVPSVPDQPLAEVFGYPLDSTDAEAKRFRKNRLCPFGNIVPNCTKDKAKDPLGVCSIYDGEETVITCPIRFRERWLIAEDAAEFLFPPDTRWTTLTEVRLNDRHGKSAGNIDVVVVAYDSSGQITDFGALEVQAVYISGNVRNPFNHYMGDPARRAGMDWTGKPNYPRPDYLSSSRKRLAPQLIYKGGILKAWRKKTVVALNRGFFQTLPELEVVDSSCADIAWQIYELKHDAKLNRYSLCRLKTVYTKFADSLDRITRSEAGEIGTFIEQLQAKIDKKLESGHAPDIDRMESPF
jgi:hypothetical protein